MQRWAHRRELHLRATSFLCGKEVSMSAHELGKDGPLSRRGFLRTTAESAAAAIAAGTFAGCQCQGTKGALVDGGIHPKYLNYQPPDDVWQPQPAFDGQRQVTADEGEYAVSQFLDKVLKVDKTKNETTLGKRPDGIHRVQLMADGAAPDFIYVLVMGKDPVPDGLLNKQFGYHFISEAYQIHRPHVAIKFHQTDIP